DPLAVPPLEYLPLNCRMIGDRSQGFEDLIGHMFDFTEARDHVSRPARAPLETSFERKRRSQAKALKEATFDQEVLSSDTPVLVDFWAEWCQPCLLVEPALEKIAEERSGQLKLVKVNIDEEQGLALRYGIASIPAMVLFKDGEPAAAAIGAQPKTALERSL